jgi:SAM-dependent methyltransferase
MNVEALNAALPKYPMSISDKGWGYGVWYCGTSWDKVRLHGQYPPTFLKRALALFPDAKDILHAPSGSLVNLPAGHVTLDASVDHVRLPMVQANCDAMPFPDSSFDLVLSDPPYTPEDSKIYGHATFPEAKFLKECHRVLRPGGYLDFLAFHYPSYRRADWGLIGLFAVVTGFKRKTRMFSVLERKAKPFGGQAEAHHDEGCPLFTPSLKDKPHD